MKPKIGHFSGIQKHSRLARIQYLVPLWKGSSWFVSSQSQRGINSNSVKVLTNLMRFLAGVAFAKYSQFPMYYVPLGILAIFFGVTEAVLSFWKEIAARVHQPGVPTYHTHPHLHRR